MYNRTHIGIKHNNKAEIELREHRTSQLSGGDSACLNECGVQGARSVFCSCDKLYHSLSIIVLVLLQAVQSAFSQLFIFAVLLTVLPSSFQPACTPSFQLPASHPSRKR